MYDLSELEPTTKEVAMGIIVVVIVLASAFAAGYLLGWERACDLHDNGTGTVNIGNELENAGTNIQHAKDGINEAQGTAGQVTGTIKDAAATTDYISGTVDNSAAIIRQCQQIIARVRSRGKKNPPAN